MYLLETWVQYQIQPFISLTITLGKQEISLQWKETPDHKSHWLVYFLKEVSASILPLLNFSIQSTNFSIQARVI